MAFAGTSVGIPCFDMVSNQSVDSSIHSSMIKYYAVCSNHRIGAIKHLGSPSSWHYSLNMFAVFGVAETALGSCRAISWRCRNTGPIGSFRKGKVPGSHRKKGKSAGKEGSQEAWTNQLINRLWHPSRNLTSRQFIFYQITHILILNQFVFPIDSVLSKTFKNNGSWIWQSFKNPGIAPLHRLSNRIFLNPDVPENHLL